MPWLILLNQHLTQPAFYRANCRQMLPRAQCQKVTQIVTVFFITSAKFLQLSKEVMGMISLSVTFAF